ncbi:MAG TPA: hypothetical protein V6C81_13810 [Planktothrix sp.]|jgi:hypothetical protein
MGKDTENMTQIRKEAIERIAKSAQARDLKVDLELFNALSELAGKRQTNVNTMASEWLKERLAKESGT